MSSVVEHANCRECKRKRNLPTKMRCSCCGKTRKCQQVRAGNVEHTWDPWYCLMECLKLTSGERDIRRKNAQEFARQERLKHPPLAWPIIGGPLNGLFAVPRDFHTGWRGEPDGRYAPHARQYREFNSASGTSKRIGGFPSMIFVHTSLLPGMIRGRDR